MFFDDKRDAWMFGSPEVQVQAVGGLFMAGQQPENVEKFRKAGFAVARPGGWDPIERQGDMVTDGVAAEVLYPSLGLGLYCVEDAALQEGLFRTYNDWIIEYCQKVPDRLYGVALISMYNVDHAIAEMERCKKQGVVGTMIWQCRIRACHSPRITTSVFGRRRRISTCRCTCIFSPASAKACTARPATA
jgi:hypothetical protein